MDAVLLSRIQFGFTAGFHFLFPPTTLGLTFVILIFETLYLKTKAEIYKNLSNFLIKILAVVFVMGVATGISLEFAFGNNWSNYSRMVGDIFGAPLAAEGILAFFLESVFLGILVFGRHRVSSKTYWTSSFLVFFASHLSGLWIIIANSWMQTPAGFKLEGNRAILTNFFEAAHNHSTAVRFLHTIIGGWITGSLLVCGIAAWYLLKNRFPEKSAVLLKAALSIFIISSFLQLGLGHWHAVQVAETQPEKMAAFEALWETENGAPFALFGIPDEKNRKTHLFIGIPKLLSFLIHFDPNAEVQGLDQVPKNEQPPVLLPFASYHFMILFGGVFLLMAAGGGFLWWKRRVHQSPRFLRLLLLAVPLPYLANEFGWIAAEVGRQPWAVYKILRTADAASPVVPAGQILFSLLLFILVYALIAIVGISIILKTIRSGPDDIETAQEKGGY